MDIYEEVAHKAWLAIKARVDELLESGTKQAELSKLLGHGGKSTLTYWKNGKSSPEKAKFIDMLRYLDALGLNIVDFLPKKGSLSVIQPIETSDTNSGPPQIPVMGATGAGNDIEYFSAVPEFYIKVPERFYTPKTIVLEVIGDSMAPTIPDGAYVGIVPHEGQIYEGRIYLVYCPPFGRVVKRIKQSEKGEIVLCSDNPSYPPRIIPIEDYEKIILGRVVWVIHNL